MTKVDFGVKTLYTLCNTAAVINTLMRIMKTQMLILEFSIVLD